MLKIKIAAGLSIFIVGIPVAKGLILVTRKFAIQ